MNAAQMNMHRKLIEHELGHALVGMLSGLRVKRVVAPPPPDLSAPPDDPDSPAGFTDFSPGGDPRGRALALLGGPLAEGNPPPSWPLEPRTDDERKLAKLVGEGDELCYLELVRDVEAIVADRSFTRMHQLASELIAHEPHELNGKQLDHIRHMAMNFKQVDLPTRIVTAEQKRVSDGVKGPVADLLLAPIEPDDETTGTKSIDTPITIATFEVE